MDTLLNNYKENVIISREVEKEVTAKNVFDALLIKKRVEEGKIRVADVKDAGVEKIMKDFSINQGEAESVLLALNKGSILATDDKNAINACKLLQIRFTTAIDLLVRAREKNLLTREEANKKLDALSKYGRYKKEIIENAKRRVK